MPHTQTALLPEDEVGHLDVGDHGPQERAVEGGGGYWHRTAGSPTQPITAHQLTWVLITRTWKSFSHSSLSIHHQLTPVSGLVDT